MVQYKVAEVLSVEHQDIIQERLGYKRQKPFFFVTADGLEAVQKYWGESYKAVGKLERHFFPGFELDGLHM